MADSSTKKNNPSKEEQNVANAATHLAGILSSGDATKQTESIARGVAIGTGNDAVQKWLNQFGTAQVQLNLDERLTLKGSQLDLLLPLYDTEKVLSFTQLGIRDIDDRVTTNLGVGQRYFSDQWLLGYNLFLDHDLSRSHTRVGVGSEYAQDNLKVAANSYFAISGWKNSRDLNGYDEKAANGFDVRAEAYLPALPQFGGKLMYEQYFGDEVGLFGKDNRQKNPSALTLGVNYTPMSLVTIGVDHKIGQGGMDETKLNLGLKYVFGVPLSQQLNSAVVALKRSLAGSRYDLVERNNHMVLQYREQSLLNVAIAPLLRGEAGETLPLAVNVTSKYDVTSFEWQTAALNSAGGQVIANGKAWSILLPAYNPVGNNSYPISVIAIDTQGNRSKPATGQVVVTGFGIDTHSELRALHEQLPADGKSQTQALLTLTNANGQPITGIAEHIELVSAYQPNLLPNQVKTAPAATSGPKESVPYRLGTLTESSTPGTYVATLTAASLPGTVTLTAKVGGTPLAQQKAVVTLVADDGTAVLNDGNVVVVNNNAIADGQDQNSIRATVVDAYDNRLANIEVTFSANSDVNFSQPTLITDDRGEVLVNLNSKVAGEHTITTSIKGSEQQVIVTFQADDSSVTVLENHALANGNATNKVQVRLIDTNNNAVSGRAISFSADNHAVIAAEGISDKQGLATVTLTNITAGITAVTATVNDSQQQINTTFIADKNTATIADGQLIVLDNGAVADGVATNRVQATVTDAYGNVVAGQTVSFSASNNALIATTGVTNEQGLVTSTLTNTSAGISAVTATINGKQQQVNTLFSGDNGSATITAENIILLNDGAVANAIATNKVQVKVTDTNGNPLTAQRVSFSATNNAIIEADSITNDEGLATVTLTNTTAGISTVTAAINGRQQQINTTFIADKNTATIADGQLIVLDNGAIADGVATNRVQATVTDAYGNVVAGQTVNFSANNSAVITAEAQTDNAGLATVTLTNKTMGITIVTAAINSSQQQVNTYFGAGDIAIGEGLSTLEVDKTSITADNEEKATFTLTLKDANRNLITGQNVTFALNDATGRSLSSVTESNGVYTVELLGTRAGPVTLTPAVAGNPLSLDLSVALTAGKVSTTTSTLQVITDNQPSDGMTKNAVKVILLDTYRNPVKNTDVEFRSNRDNTILQTLTSADGIITFDFNSLVGGTHTITATIDGVFLTTTVNFTSAKVTATTDKSRVKVGETIVMTLQALDGNNTLMPNVGLTLSSEQIVDRQNSPRSDSGALLLNGAEFTGPINTSTGASGSVDISVTDPKGIGVETTIKVTAGNTVKTVPVIFSVITSPDSSKANMWGHMTEIVSAAGKTFMRPPLATEASSKTSNFNLYREVWAGFASNAVAAQYCATAGAEMPSVPELQALASTTLTDTHGWQNYSKAYWSNTPNPGAAGEYYSVNLSAGNTTSPVAGPNVNDMVTCKTSG